MDIVFVVGDLVMFVVDYLDELFNVVKVKVDESIMLMVMIKDCGGELEGNVDFVIICGDV